MSAPCVRRGATIGHLVLNGTIAALSGRQLAAADVLSGTAGEIVGLAYVGDGTRSIAHAVFAGLGGRLLPNAGGGVVLVGTAGFVDCHVCTSFVIDR